MTASMYSELGGIAYLAWFFSFLLIPYTILTIAERENQPTALIDRVYDSFAIIITIGIIGRGAVSGVEGLLAVMVGVGSTVALYTILIVGLIIIVGISNLLTRKQTMYNPPNK